MKTQHPAVVIMAVVILSLSACSKRDRDEAKKTSDGTETFVYVKPDLKKYSIKTPPPDASASKANPSSNADLDKKAESVKSADDRDNE
jgi:type IV secretory pathway VirB10-like protein